MSKPLSTSPKSRRNPSDEGAQPEELLTIAEVAEYLKLSRRTAWRWCKSGRLPAVKVGRQWRIVRRDLDRLVHKNGRIVTR